VLNVVKGLAVKESLQVCSKCTTLKSTIIQDVVAHSLGEIHLHSRGTVSCLPVLRVCQTSSQQEAGRKQSCFRLVSCFAYSLNLKMEAVPLKLWWTSSGLHGVTLHTHCSEILKSECFIVRNCVSFVVSKYLWFAAGGNTLHDEKHECVMGLHIKH
jgi:hypothetical protein